MNNETNRYFGNVFNPLNKPVEELPIIFGFNNGGRPNFYEGILVSQDGVHLGGHVSSSESWLRIDLGVVESPFTINNYEIKHKRFREHYPNGYIMEFVCRDDVSTHNELRRAIQLLTEKSNNHEGAIMKNDINDTTTEVRIKQLPHAEGLPLPEYKTSGSVGFDFQAAIAMDDPILIAPGERVSIPTGLAVAIPEGLELQVRPRSGLAMYNGIMVVNTPGTVDQDYRGELIILLLNTDRNNTFIITRGDRIAQGVISPIERVRFKQVNELPSTVRGEGGFGSTGI